MAENTARKLTTREFLKLRDEGAEFNFPERMSKIEGFDEMIEAMKSMVSNNSARVEADSARSQSMLEILATIQVLVRKSGERRGAQGTPLNMAKVEKALDQIRDLMAMPKPLVSYEFDFQRNQQGFTNKIIATPVPHLAGK